MSAVAGEMVCAELVELVTEYWEGALPDRDRRRFEAHLAECGPCTRYLEQLRATIGATGTLREDNLPPVVAGELLRAFRGWATNARRPDDP